LGPNIPLNSLFSNTLTYIPPVTFSHAPGISPTKGNYQPPSKVPNNQNIATIKPCLKTWSITHQPNIITYSHRRSPTRSSQLRHYVRRYSQ
jgi:hypothetical protein